MAVVATRRAMLGLSMPGARGVTMKRSRVLLVAPIAVSLLAVGLPFRSGGPIPFVQTAQAQSGARALINRLFGRGLPAGVVDSNGRIEATQIDIAPKYAGRLSEVSVEEGDTVTAGQVVARISAPEYDAQLRGAQSEVLRAQQTKAQAEALIAERNSDVQLAALELHRTEELVKNGHATRQLLDQRRSSHTAAMASLRAAVAQREQANFAMKTAQADVERLESVIADLVLHAPRAGRVQYKLRRAGEVVPAGTPVLTILDLTDVYLTIFLPAAQAGRLKLGGEARVVLDPVPQYVVPATVRFVAPEAQFTPKTVETREEREKLVFRVKLQIDPDVLKTHEGVVKAGVRGMGFVRTDPSVPWPDNLQVKLPQ
jgi:HlyD family secretion protein